jgi:nucleoside-diphosphate-sugar epimerase
VHEAKQAGAKSITVWGTGTPRREFLHTTDLAEACLFLLENYDEPDLVNIGCGEDVTIRELAETVCDVLGFDGTLEFDASKPDGTPRKLLFLGSSCIYPKMAPQPIPESALLTGPLEPTNDAYAIAKIAGIKLCQSYAREYGKNFISGMPTNLYGPHDNYDLHNSHVLPAFIRKVHEAKQSGAKSITVWGTGTPRREFLHTTDLAEACLFLLEHYDEPDLVNIGCGEDVTIRELAETVCDVLGFDGTLEFDASKPDGTPRKLLDISKIKALGWSPRIPLREGIADAYRWFRENYRDARL